MATQTETPKRKRGELSSTSDLDTSKDIYYTPTHEKDSKVSKGKQKQTKAQRRKAARIDMKNAELYLDLSVPPEKRVSDKKEETSKCIETQLEEIYSKLSNVIASSDRSTLKELIKETFLELRDSLIGSLIKCIEIIESELHEKVLENETMKKELKKMGENLAKKEEENNRIETMLQEEKVRAAEQINEQEQYSRRNNIRIVSLADEPKETSRETTEKVLRLFKDKLKISLTQRDIDIAHRLGKYKQGTNRQVIVKFVNRHEKAQIMTYKKMLKGTKISIFEDLTRVNNEVLASTRKKLPNEVDQSWSTEGKIFIKWKANAKIERIRFNEYQHWLDLPWP